MSLFGAFWDKDPNPVGTENFGNNKGLFHNLDWTPKGVLHIGAWDAWEAKQYETENLKFIQSDLTESFVNKFPIKFDFMFTNAVLPHIPLEFKSDVFKNLAEVANPGCIFVMYDGMLNDNNKHKHDGNEQADFENWSGREIIRVVFISEKWIRENATDWEIVQITNVGHATEEIILKRK